MLCMLKVPGSIVDILISVIKLKVLGKTGELLRVRAEMSEKHRSVIWLGIKQFHMFS